MEKSKKIIESIIKAEIKPKPRWQFILGNNLVWVGLFLFTVLGAIAFSIILLSVQQTDFQIISHLSHSKWEMFLGLLPFIWILFILVFLVLAILSIKHSWKGYKISPLRLVTINAALSIGLGTLFFIYGGAQRLEHVFDLKMGNYQSIEERKMAMWSNPEEGLLSGRIEKVDKNIIFLNDFNDQLWEIDYQDAFVAPILLLEMGETIKIIGEPTNNKEFVASEVRPWGGPGNRGKGRNRRMIDSSN